MKALIGKKIGMTQIFDENGQVIPVTMVSAEANVVTQIKLEDIDGYKSVQIAVPTEKKIKRPQENHFAKAGIKSRQAKEFSFDQELKIGDKLDLSQFKIGELIAVSGISKGKGFAGTVKRHNFNTGPRTHGSNNYRRPGSIGAQQPQRVVKGKRMAGHMGHEMVTTKNLKVVHIDIENHVVLLRGAVPGANNSIVYIWSNND